MAALLRGLLIVVVAALAAPAAAWARDVEVVVRLDAPGLAEATAHSQVLTRAAKEERLDLGSPSARAYLRSLDGAHRRFEARLSEVPNARVRWRYRIVLNAVAVVVQERDVPRLHELPGVRDVLPNARYTARLDRSPASIGAPVLWNDPLQPTRGEGMKIGIIDDGIDPAHPFFSPTGYTMPPGFPKGQTAYTTAKVIAARAFSPPGATWRYANVPLDPANSGHGTHVAGIAAGNAGTPTSLGPVVSGVAPRAHLGNYRVMTVPAENVGLNGNAPEIVRGIEAAVADGMDVINLSLGEPEVEPSRDAVALALDAAAAAGVVPVVAAGNQGDSLGDGSVGSPASSRRAITVGAVAVEGGALPALASFSSAGPTPLSYRLKPDVVAPGVTILSSSPAATWELASGTSMAAPHVAGAAALLRRRHPEWTVDQLRSALVTTAAPVRRASAHSQGGGVVDVAAAVSPLVLATPSTISFGVVRAGGSARAVVRLADAGGGAGVWSVAGADQRTVTVPGTLTVSQRAPALAGVRSGWVVLSRGSVTRRIPFVLVASRPSVPRPSASLRRAGTYRGSTVGRPARVLRYRFPAVGEVLRGPEQTFRVVLRRPAANFGVAVLAGAVEPRIVRHRDQSRLAGVSALPRNSNPYHHRFDRRVPIAGVLYPLPGSYDVVFDSHAARGSRFAFRLWIDDRTPPSARLLNGTAVRAAVSIRVADRGSGVDPTSLRATVRGVQLPVALRRGVARVDVRELSRGAHTLEFQVSDRQEAKNDENVAGVLPNTRRLRVTIRVP